MKITGELKEKMEVQTYGEGDKTFTKQTLIFSEVEPEVEYPNTIAIDFSGDHLITAGNMQVGATYKINFNITAKKTDKGGVFNTIRGRKVKEIAEEMKTEDLPF